MVSVAPHLISYSSLDITQWEEKEIHRVDEKGRKERES